MKHLILITPQGLILATPPASQASKQTNTQTKKIYTVPSIQNAHQIQKKINTIHSVLGWYNKTELLPSALLSFFDMLPISKAFLAADTITSIGGYACSEQQTSS